MRLLYVVTGTCGVYSEKEDWNCKAFFSKEKAVKFAIRLNEEAERLLNLSDFAFDNLSSIDYFSGEDYMERYADKELYPYVLHRWYEEQYFTVEELELEEEM